MDCVEDSAITSRHHILEEYMESVSVDITNVKGKKCYNISDIIVMSYLHLQPDQKNVIGGGITGIHSNITRLRQCKKL